MDEGKAVLAELHDIRQLRQLLVDAHHEVVGRDLALGLEHCPDDRQRVEVLEDAEGPLALQQFESRNQPSRIAAEVGKGIVSDLLEAVDDTVAVVPDEEFPVVDGFGNPEGRHRVDHLHRLDLITRRAVGVRRPLQDGQVEGEGS